MTSPCCGLCSTGTHDALKKNAANWVQRQSIKRSLQTGVKLRKETGASHRSATSLHALPAASCSNRLFLSISPLLILTHTGGFHCTQQDPAAQQAPSPDSPSRPQPRPSGTGCLASLHLPQSASPAAACRWAPLSEDRAL